MSSPAATRYASSSHVPVQDMQCVENCNDPNPANHVLYEQPVWQTLQMFRASLLLCPAWMCTLTARHPPRQSERCSVRPFARPCACAALTIARCTCLSSGFLPVIYSLIRARRQSQPLRLPSDSEEEPAAGAKAEVPQARLRGWKLLLLWFPAACDLTGTTVRLRLALTVSVFS